MCVLERRGDFVERRSNVGQLRAEVVDTPCRRRDDKSHAADDRG